MIIAFSIITIMGALTMTVGLVGSRHQPMANSMSVLSGAVIAVVGVCGLLITL